MPPPLGQASETETHTNDQHQFSIGARYAGRRGHRVHLDDGAEKHHFRRTRAVVTYRELEFAELRPPVTVLNSDDVVLDRNSCRFGPRSVPVESCPDFPAGGRRRSGYNPERTDRHGNRPRQATLRGFLCRYRSSECCRRAPKHGFIQRVTRTEYRREMLDLVRFICQAASKSRPAAATMLFEPKRTGDRWISSYDIDDSIDRHARPASDAE
jgi:hypothetical protein